MNIRKLWPRKKPIRVLPPLQRKGHWKSSDLILCSIHPLSLRDIPPWGKMRPSPSALGRWLRGSMSFGHIAHSTTALMRPIKRGAEGGLTSFFPQPLRGGPQGQGERIPPRGSRRSPFCRPSSSIKPSFEDEMTLLAVSSSKRAFFVDET